MKTLEVNSRLYTVTRAVKADRVCCPCILDGQQCIATFVNKTRATTCRHIFDHFKAAGSSLGKVYYKEWLREGKTMIFFRLLPMFPVQDVEGLHEAKLKFFLIAYHSLPLFQNCFSLRFLHLQCKTRQLKYLSSHIYARIMCQFLNTN